MIAAPDLSAIQLNVPLPVMHRARQTFEGPVLEDIEGETRRQVRRFADTITPGAHIAITAGSRGIANIARVSEAAFLKGGLPASRLAQCSAGFGLAGANMAGASERVLSHNWPFQLL